MFNKVSSFLWSAWETATQLPMAIDISTESEKKVATLAWANLPNMQIAGCTVPKDVVHLIFSRLTYPEHLFKVRMVCRLWCQVASQFLTLPRLFPDAPVLNRPVWERHIDLEKHGLVFENGKEPPPLTKREYIETERMASEVESGRRITILTLPKGLTLNKIIAFAGAPKMGNSIPFASIDPSIIDRIIELYGDQKIKETITVVMTNGVFNNSRDGSLGELEAIVKRAKCEMPELVPFMAHIVLSFIRSPAHAPLRLFGPETYTRILEDLDGDKAIVAGLSEEGPYAFSLHIAYEYHGVGGMKKFPALRSNSSEFSFVNNNNNEGG